MGRLHKWHIKGPLLSSINKLIPDGSLKARLKAEIEQRLLQSDDRLVELQGELLATELRSESRLTRSWRPMLMYLIMLLLMVYGLLLPLYEAVFGPLEHFEPRWNQFPEGLWILLMLGVGGYISGRTVEKHARGGVSGGTPPSASRPTASRKQRRNFNR